jgi:hypothetical protein
MNQLSGVAGAICAWIKKDFNEHPLRFILEVTAWITSIACSVIMALTLPHPPFLLLYPMFIAQCGVFAWAAWSRKSFGMLGNYVLLLSIDTAALIRLVTL